MKRSYINIKPNQIIDHLGEKKTVFSIFMKR